ncbi:catalase [Massilia antarctica]
MQTRQARGAAPLFQRGNPWSHVKKADRPPTAQVPFSAPSRVPRTRPCPAAWAAPIPARSACSTRLAAKPTWPDERPFNATKPLEYGDAARTPHAGEAYASSTPLATASTSTESIASPKVGAGTPHLGDNALNSSLDRVRADATEQRLTTNQAVPLSSNQDSLKIGLRGPVALEDFVLREKITHFDHERIPERVVHARGSAAHGYFESYQDLCQLTRAATA